MSSLVVIHPVSNTCTTVLNKAEYTNTQQDLTVGDNYITNSRHGRLLAVEFFC
jgi:hypothetical protein